jgi:hypothetical protein
MHTKMHCGSSRVQPFILGPRRGLKTLGNPLGEGLDELLEDPSDVGNGRFESTRCGGAGGVR